MHAYLLSKKKGYSWKRLRRSTFGKPDVEDYELKTAQLEDLFVLENTGFIDLFFADESGFSLTPCVPYGWQKIGETQSIPTRKSKQFNVFGLISRNNKFESYWTEGSNTTSTIIAFIDDFAQKQQSRTVIVLDNAPIHRSDEFMDKIEEWKELDVEIFFLPTYSPHLNLIETLWRKIKYEWLKPQDFRCIKSLREALRKILAGIGYDYFVNFKPKNVSINYM